jgi:cyclophilin family peptidyl-prolyl cis-trans isomerase
MNAFAMSPIPFFRAGAMLLAAAALTACGGGGSGEASVTNLSASPVMYGRTMTLTVTGAGLSSGLTASVDPGCVMTRGTTGQSDTNATFTCKLGALGDLRAHVRTAEGKELASLRLDVPLPQVQMRVEQTVNSATQGGNYVIELDPTKAPKTVDNFLNYVNASGGCYFRNTLYHRVISNFVVQAGGFTTGMVAKPALAPAIALESNNGLKNLRGTVAMARTSAPNSATSQFFINVQDNPSLDYVSEANPGYAVFGQVISGMDVIDVLKAVPVANKSVGGVTYENVPVDEVTISFCAQIR